MRKINIFILWINIFSISGIWFLRFIFSEKKELFTSWKEFFPKKIFFSFLESKATLLCLKKLFYFLERISPIKNFFFFNFFFF